MDITIPFTKDILFKTKIGEIVSISLEHEVNIEDNEVVGNFIVSGEYKTHTVSVNKEEFFYKLPFNVQLSDNINKDTFSLEIRDFNYEVIDKDILRVNIEFNVTALEKKEEPLVEFEKVDEDLSRDILEDVMPVTIEEDVLPLEKEITQTVEDNIEDEEERKLAIEDISNDDISKEEENDSKTLERLEESSENTVIESTLNQEEEYITYNVHILRNNETIESICALYNVNIDIVKEYNNLENLNIGDKIIIPYEIDE